MQNESEHKIDREGWSRGPWDDEPDKLNWTTSTGLPGMIVRNRIGALCGYVAVDRSHPLHAVEYNGRIPSNFEGPPEEYSDYESSPEGRFNVHGGLTYSNACAGHICHVPEPGEPDDVWWFGFDCAHAGDEYPSDRQYSCGDYRDVAYVKAEVENLAVQLRDFALLTTTHHHR